MSIIAPLATGIVNGNPVRFFRSPIEGADFPWHAFMDLHAAMGLPADVQEHFLRMMRSGPYRASTYVIATADGPAVIAAHYTAQGFLDALKEIGRAPPDAEADYYNGLSEAIDAQSVGLSDEARFTLVIEMGRRHVAGQVEG